MDKRILIFAMILFLASCGKKDPETEKPKTEDVAEEEKEDKEEEIEEEPEEKPKPEEEEQPEEEPEEEPKPEEQPEEETIEVEEIEDNPVVEEGTFSTEDQLLKELKYIANTPAEGNVPAIAVTDVSTSASTVSVTLDIQGTNPAIDAGYATLIVGSITEHLLEMEEWQHFEIIFKDKGNLTLDESQKSVDEYGPYFDEIETGYEEQIHEIFENQ